MLQLSVLAREFFLKWLHVFFDMIPFVFECFLASGYSKMFQDHHILSHSKTIIIHFSQEPVFLTIGNVRKTKDWVVGVLVATWKQMVLFCNGGIVKTGAWE